MKRFAEQFKKKSDAVRMRAAEKRELKERLVSYMEYHPLPKTATQKAAEAYVQSESFTFINFNTPQVRGFFGAFAVFMLILVPVVAERAVPGDVLYPVKVSFNEEIRSTLAVSPYAKIEWETTRLERRIAEARLLASEGKLTEEAEAEVAAAVKQHSDAAQEGIAALRSSDSDEAAIAEITFESALAVQSEVLEGALEKEVAAQADTEATPGRSVAALATVIADAQKDAAGKQSGQTPSYEKLSARIESETTRAFELFESVKEVASAEEVSDIERRLTDIERKIAEAATRHTEEDAVEAEVETDMEVPAVLPEIALLRTALSDLQKLISFMTDIDVRENVTIEALVPVTLTPEERLDAAKEVLLAIESTIETIDARAAAREDDERTEKLTLIIANIHASASSSASALESADAVGAEKANAETNALIVTANDILGPAPETVGVEEAEAEEAVSDETDEMTEENEEVATSSVDIDGEVDVEVE